MKGSKYDSIRANQREDPLGWHHTLVGLQEDPQYILKEKRGTVISL